jgi:hypothetical protein
MTGRGLTRTLMMKRWTLSRRLWRVWVPGGWLLLLGGCGLSDVQLTSILQSAVTTGLNALFTQLISTLFGAVTSTV